MQDPAANTIFTAKPFLTRLRLADGARVTLSNATLTVSTGLEVHAKQELASEAEYYDALDEWFGVPARHFALKMPPPSTVLRKAAALALSNPS